MTLIQVVVLAAVHHHTIALSSSKSRAGVQKKIYTREEREGGRDGGANTGESNRASSCA